MFLTKNQETFGSPDLLMFDEGGGLPDDALADLTCTTLDDEAATWGVASDLSAVGTVGAVRQGRGGCGEDDGVGGVAKLPVVEEDVGAFRAYEEEALVASEHGGIDLDGVLGIAGGGELDGGRGLGRLVAEAYLDGACAFGVDGETDCALRAEIDLAELCPGTCLHLYLQVARGVVAEGVDGGVLDDVAEVLVGDAATGGHGLGLLFDVGVEVLDGSDARLVERHLIDGLRALVHRGLVHTDGTES